MINEACLNSTDTPKDEQDNQQDLGWEIGETNSAELTSYLFPKENVRTSYPPVFAENELNHHIKNLNKTQKEIFDIVNKLGRSVLKKVAEDPLFIFITGGAGV